jgi:hypothetical protein
MSNKNKDKNKAKWLAKHYQDVATGGKSQYTHGNGWYDADGGPCFHSIESEWRVVQSERNKDD